ncbi:prolyl oligopeptidase family protein [Sphingosinicella sp. CPCC 101087]|uniref:prolyl oligopeptidase family serine peptidase n=1 Tax=Sphingosinicella sp. CPCC 101087 TaxID=2497754 RepID=UPI00197FE195|nr:prolyl oligopeptidase family serine peptidase [Sphingosinicella sp. CPCC 101087]
MASIGAAQSSSGAAPADDPHVWLEEIEGERALAWARAENERTLGELQADPRYRTFHDQALEILQASDRIPLVSMRPSGLYNFWQDETHVRGIVRRTTLESYRTDSPAWETVLDVDALARAESANWVYRGLSCLPPEERRCLVVLSDGGRDASVVREFDLIEGRSVEDGFSLPDGKQSFAWLDEDTILVAREWGPGTMTASGYPFVVKRLRRGQPLDEAEEIFRGTREDVSVTPFVLRDAAGMVHAVGASRGLDFFDREYTILREDGPVRLNLPRKSSLAGLVDGRVIVALQEAWEAAPGLAFATDSLISYDLEEWKSDPNGARPGLVWAPGPRQTLGDFATTRDQLLIAVLDNVRGRAMAMNYEDGAWRSRPLALPQNASIGIAAASDESVEAMFTVTDYLTPSTLWHYDGATGAVETIKTTPPRFDASGHVVEQHEAASRDGTRIPYFLIRPHDMKLDGSTPTLLNGYGGFQVPMVPSYMATTGRLWLEQGNAYVVANLRGGGEFGPDWHQAAQRRNKQRTWDDFIAVAEDLVRRGVTSPRRLGVVGGSQGGLLVGTAITQRPDLFNAAIIQVPLFDMIRYPLMGAGASWIGEYGDPSIPEQKAWIEGYSPYQRLVAGQDYPRPFILTSTKDDRVHPGHGRKAAARLAELGQPYLYYENIDGGHSAAANLRETARRLALEFIYASKRLAD